MEFSQIRNLVSTTAVQNCTAFQFLELCFQAEKEIEMLKNTKFNSTIMTVRDNYLVFKHFSNGVENHRWFFKLSECCYYYQCICESCTLQYKLSDIEIAWSVFVKKLETEYTQFVY